MDQVFGMDENEKKKAKYEEIGSKMLAGKDVGGLVSLAEHLVNKEGREQYGRTYITGQVLCTLVGAIKAQFDHLGPESAAQPEDLSLEQMTTVLTKWKDLIAGKAYFSMALYKSIGLLAEVLMETADTETASRIHASFKFDQSMDVSADEKAAWHIKSSRLFLEVCARVRAAVVPLAGWCAPEPLPLAQL